MEILAYAMPSSKASNMLIMKSKTLFLLLATIAAILAAGFALQQNNPKISNFSNQLFGWFGSNSNLTPGNFRIVAINTVCVNGFPQATVSWTNSANATAYNLERKLSGSGNWQTTGQTSQLSLTDSTWKPGYQTGTYIYRVQALGGRSRKQTTAFSYTQTVIIVSCSGQTPPPPTTSAPSAPVSTQALLPVSYTAPAPAPVSSGIKWGAFPGSSDAASIESLAGKKMSLEATFVGWGSGNNFPSSMDKSRTPVIFWEQYGTTLDAIISGSQDSYISQFASAAKAYGSPVILAPFHEMNGDWDPWGGTMSGNTPAKVISAWRHVYSLFSGVTNVKFAWDVNNQSEPDVSSNSIATYYPGDAYVDYVGVDGFNFNNPWQTFSQVFPASLMQQLKSYNKPVYILSTASAAGTQKAQWIKDLGTYATNYGIAGWVWFNENKEQNWLFNSDPSSLSAFKSILP
jgi:hypothetical protein